MPNPSNLNLASGASIPAALSNLASQYNSRNAWLDSNSNKYVVDTISKIEADMQTTSISNNEMVDYMATSVFVHCFNGWTYLSNAISALLEGDHANAIHNAYYGELRGIMSILASQGVGVFNKFNLLIDSQGIVKRVTPPKVATHVFAKNAFDELISNPANSQFILSQFTVNNTTLKEWINHTGFSSEIASELAADKLKQWSLDLNTIKNETYFRNFVSYNPMRMELNPPAQADNIEDRYKFIVDLWKLCGPNNLFEFSILRNTYENLYATLNFPVKNLDMDADWKRIFTDLGLNIADANSQQIIQFLRRDINIADNLVFDYAENITTSTPLLERDVEPFGIISRACLMLLINTKIVESLIRQSGTSKDDLKFWFDNIGIKSGFWKAGSEPTSLSELYSDIELEIEDIETWLKKTPPQFDAYAAKTDLKSSTVHIRNFAKAYLWNTGL